MANITFSFAPGLNDSIFGKAQAPISAMIAKRGEAFEQNSQIDKIFDAVSSDGWGEQYTSMTGYQGFKPVGENGKHPIDGSQESFKKLIEPVTWKDKFSISREAIDDMKVLKARDLVNNFTAAYYRTREIYAAAMLGGAIVGNTEVTYDGWKFDAKTADDMPLFDKTHKSILKSTYKQSNKFADEFSGDALSAAETAMQNFCDDAGNTLDISPDTIIIPNDYALKKSVIQVVGSDKEPDNNNNGFNMHYGRWNILVNPYLNKFITPGTKPWVLVDSRANKLYHGMIWQNRLELDVKSYEDHDTDANVWTGIARYAVGFNDWRPVSVGGVSGGTQLITA